MSQFDIEEIVNMIDARGAFDAEDDVKVLVTKTEDGNRARDVLGGMSTRTWFFPVGGKGVTDLLRNRLVDYMGDDCWACTIMKVYVQEDELLPRIVNT